MISQLHKYESGHYGLSDALEEVQKYQKQVHIRDKQVMKLIQDLNKLQAVCDKLEQENFVLREKLQLAPKAPIVTNGVISKQQKQKKLIHNLQNQIELLEDEKLQFKVKQRKYNNQFKNLEEQIIKLGGTPILDESHESSVKQITIIKSNDKNEYKTRFKEAVEENDALRKGMHEILESIKIKNGKLKT